MEKLNSVWGEIDGEEEKLEGNISCEILIVGGGIAGLLTAYYLTGRGHNVVLVEANKIASRVTRNTTATITSQQGLIYCDIARKYGEDKAKAYYASQEEGINLYEKLIEKLGIRCDFAKLDGYFYSTGDNKKLQQEYQTLKLIGASVEYFDTLADINLAVTGVIKQPNQAQFNVIEFLTGLPKQYKIYENSRVERFDLEKKIAFTDCGQVKYKQVILATHYPIINKKKLLFSKIYQSTTYAVSFTNCDNINGIYNDDKEDGFTLRGYNGALIVGGADHRTGRNKSQNQLQKIEDFAYKLFPNCQKQSSWASEDCATFDHMPMAGKLDEKNGVFVITGFNKWGMANSIVCAKVIADLIDGESTEYTELFALERRYLTHSMGGYLKNMFVAVGGMAKSFLKVPLKRVKNLRANEAGIFLVKGKKLAIYKDDSGQIFAINARCPHLGCELKFNYETITWDCPCHGSRFDIFGEIVAEPAVKKAVTK